MDKLQIKEEILDLMKVKYEPLLDIEIAEKINVPYDDIFLNALNELTDECKIFKTKNNRYLNDKLSGKYLGKISIRNNNYGFVTNPYYDDLYVDSIYFNGAMDKDEVLYVIDDNKRTNKSREAKIVKIVKRYYDYLVGEIIYENGHTVLDTFEKDFQKKCFVNKLENAKVGDIVLVKITDYGYYLKSKVINVLGKRNDLGIDITSVVVKEKIPYIFSKEVIEEANILQNKAKDGNYEIFDDLIFTIDGDNAKDLDDAISIKKKTNGNYELNVYIASVSSYVLEESEIDKEALNRGTSIYLVDRVIPMLPENLSNNICSLHPGEEKLVMGLFMEVDNKGNVIDRKIKEGVIKTTKRLSYNKCNDVLENGLINYPDYGICLNTLKVALELSEILQQKRKNRGAIDFDTDEVEIICDEKGKAIDIKQIKRGKSEKIIEEFMILANETVSEIISSFDLPFIYRVHEEPDIVKFHILKEMVEKLGYSIKSLHPKEFQKLLEDITEQDSYLKESILRLMNKAVYSENNIGHFGLASRFYTHFTSPIRRYPDLIVHRLLRKYALNNEIELTNYENNYLENKLHNLSELCSVKERRAISVEFKVLDMKKAEYMENYIGDTYYGIVTSIHKFGIFVTLENTVDGLIKSSNLMLNNFIFNNIKNIYINPKTDKKIVLGEKIKVKLVKVNKKIGEIDFELMYNNKHRRSNPWKK